MRIGMLSPIAWRTPPRHYGPWESVTSHITEGLVTQGHDVTLFATTDSQTRASLHAVCTKGYEENPDIVPKVWEGLHISEIFEHADEFDIIHNNFDFLPLTYTGLVNTPVITTIHGFSSPGIIPAFKKYNKKVFYVSISDSDRSPDLDYIKTIHHGLDINQFDFQPKPDDYLLFFGRFHHDKGAKEAIEIAKACNKRLIMAGIIQDESYFKKHIEPFIDNDRVVYIGSADPVKRSSLLGKASAMLHPINFNEPFGLSVIESMACGTPVIAINRGSMPELIQNNKNGFLVSNTDEAVKAVNRIKEIDRNCCRKTVEDNFTVDRMVDKYIEVYEQILKKTKHENNRPWGYYKILADEKNYKSKEIVVFPNKRLSLQRHQQRDEHWYILEGHAEVTLGESTLKLGPGESINILRGSLHRIENTGLEKVVFIEVQTGEYFGEDDIERLEDDFGRS